MRKLCRKCKSPHLGLSLYCGAIVCGDCGDHDGLTRCYCGWSESGRDGRAELIEMGETIDEEE